MVDPTSPPAGPASATGPGFCAGCGRPTNACAGCSRDLDPPRFCRRCGRRLTVAVSPSGFRARCRDHGTARRQHFFTGHLRPAAEPRSPGPEELLFVRILKSMPFVRSFAEAASRQRQTLSFARYLKIREIWLTGTGEGNISPATGKGEGPVLPRRQPEPIHYARNFVFRRLRGAHRKPETLLAWAGCRCVQRGAGWGAGVCDRFPSGRRTAAFRRPAVSYTRLRLLTSKETLWRVLGDSAFIVAIN